jgi:methionyl-tRNA formyltransferase
MKIVIFTSNSFRHKFLANSLSKFVDDALIVIECRENDELNYSYGDNELIMSHFKRRYQTEKEEFGENDEFLSKCIPILHKEVNSEFIFQKIQKYDPDVMIIFGSSIIKEPLLSLGKKNKFLNLHLGLSPYYKGNATNFWPFVNNELECLGSTILHVDAGIDTGDIITHVKPKIEIGDNVHTIGCKIIRESVSKIKEILNLIKNGDEINRVKQWKVNDEKIYRLKDFDEDILKKYLQNIDDGIVEKYVNNEKKEVKIIDEIKNNN